MRFPAWLGVVLALLAYSDLGRAQALPDLLVTPTKATMLVGETQVFRAVGAGGRLKSGVSWQVAPHATADIQDGDELEIRAVQPGKITITASADDHEAQAEITVLPGSSLPAGTSRFELAPLPGYHIERIIQAQRVSDSGPDFYLGERGPQGSVIRAVTADGRELWRTGGGKPGEPFKPPAEPGLNHKTLCDAVSVGMSKLQVTTLARERGLEVSPAITARSVWTLEETGAECSVEFDARGRATQKKKVITN